jgi:hypothetical protein
VRVVPRTDGSRRPYGPPARFRSFYIDDSGAPGTGCIVYSWIEVRAGLWTNALAQWLDFRRSPLCSS